MNAARRICYLTGTRADFGLLAGSLRRLNAEPGVEVGLLVTGMHLSPAYGETVREVEASGLPVWARVPVDIEARSPQGMARACAQVLAGATEALATQGPDLLLLLGDRGEMLAGAIAALHLGIPVAHLHGGERSGTIDEPMRHAITKLAHIHLVASEESRARVVRLGERPEHVHVVGAPSLDDLVAEAPAPREQVLAQLGLAPGSRYVLVLFHPVVQEAGAAPQQTAALAQALREVALAAGRQVVWLAPNADAGSAAILAAMQAAHAQGVQLRTHLPRPQYLQALRQADALVGNSSSGIIEAATAGTPVVNIGNRQRLRQRNGNTIDCGTEAAAIAQALRRALSMGRWEGGNVYGDGRAGERIAQLLATLPLPRALLDKTNAY